MNRPHGLSINIFGNLRKMWNTITKLLSENVCYLEDDKKMLKLEKIWINLIAFRKLDV